MATEYVKLSSLESIYGQKQVLHTELELLGIVKRIMAFQKLRQEELILKIALKKEFDDTMENLKLLDKLLPHTKMTGLIKKEFISEEIEEERGVLTLEQEIEQIKRRLEKLHGW